jgi:hypothetical protein
MADSVGYKADFRPLLPGFLALTFYLLVNRVPSIRRNFAHCLFKFRGYITTHSKLYSAKTLILSHIAIAKLIMPVTGSVGARTHLPHPGG